MSPRRQTVIAALVLTSLLITPVTAVSAGGAPTDGPDVARQIPPATSSTVASSIIPTTPGAVASPIAAESAGRPAGRVTASTAAIPSGARDGGVDVVYRPRTTDTPGVVAVEATVQIPVTISEFDVYLPGHATVTATDGFHEAGGEADLEWDGTTDTPTFTYRLTVNRTGDLGFRTSVATTEWALVANLNRIRYTWRYTGSSPSFETHNVLPDGVTGVAADDVVFVGAHRTHEWAANNQRFRLVVPNVTEVGVSRAAVIAALSDASTRLRVGDRDPLVTVVVGPPAMCRAGATDGCGAGYQSGDAAFWVSTGSPVNGSSTWIHEYVHTRQDFELTTTAPATTWLTEAIATYYEVLLPLQQGRVGYDRFYAVTTSTGSVSGTLTEPGTWSVNELGYTRGARLVAALDARIRLASNGTRTFQDVFRQMNRHQGTITYTEFRGMVVDAGNESVGTFLDRYARRDEPAPVPDSPYLYTSGPTADDDGDGLNTTAERSRGTSPFAVDTDGDGLLDPIEPDETGTDPLTADTDGDGLDDGAEVNEYGTDPLAADSDGDGIDDGPEVNQYGTDPLTTDSDGDGLEDGAEVNEYDTDPLAADTDGDGVDDGTEVRRGSDPKNAPTPTPTATPAPGASEGGSSGSAESTLVTALLGLTIILGLVVASMSLLAAVVVAVARRVAPSLTPNVVVDRSPRRLLMIAAFGLLAAATATVAVVSRGMV